ncbi:MAG: (Fe-S)-binding protein [Gracilibacteraceae bacterium]|jgi:Fe-S oxidoreductase/nitrate reductase gamma subunit|nr:(Fe-S)-binding protein [Gracilibacteraceae bacterium]
MQAAVFLVLLLAALTAFVLALTKKISYLTAVAPENRFDQPLRRLGHFVRTVLFQSKMAKEWYGIIHIFIFWGFIFIVLAEIPFIIEGLFPAVQVPFLGTNPYFYLVKDILSLLVVLGLLIGIARRWIVRPKRLYRSPEAAIIVALILAVIITDWLTGGAKCALTGSIGEAAPAYRLAFCYQGFADIFYQNNGPETLAALMNVMWWIHVLIILGFLVYIPNSKHMHLLAAPFNGYFASLLPLGRQTAELDPLADAYKDAKKEYGVGRIENFTWKQLLDCFACGECGRCMANCPANLAGKNLNPKHFLSHTLKDHLLAKGEQMRRFGLQTTEGLSAEELDKLAGTDLEAAVLKERLVGDVFRREDLWACTTCASCQSICPVSNEHVQKIIDMRRFEVMNEDDYAPELRLAFRNVESKFNPWGVSWSERAAWAKDVGAPIRKERGEAAPEYLLWAGCAGSFDNRAKKTSIAVAKILRAAGIDFAILGREEKCCGDFARRAGNEYLFRLLAAENVKILNGYGVKKIITACPHCLQTLQNEYPAFGGNFEVTHHTRFILELIRSGRLSLRGEGGPARRAVYHDSCYLGRYQGEYEAPRALLAQIPNLTLAEMERCRDKSFCCGAGGARMWMEESVGMRLSNLRVEQALAQSPEIICANCPYCITMLEDGVKDKDGANVPVFDPAELIAELL